MPEIKSAKQYGFMQALAHGTSNKPAPKSLTPEKAHEGIMELSPGKRSRFAKQQHKGKKKMAFRFPSAQS